MINRIKFLTVLFLGSLGLSGCVLVDDEFATYSSYPYGSYESAVDYYHRPPRHYMSNHKHTTTVHTKKPHLDKPEPPKHIIKQEPPKHINKHEPPKHIDKHGHPDTKLHQPIKEKAPKISHQPAPKHDMIKKHEPKPIKEDLHKGKMPEKPEHSIKEKAPDISQHHAPKQDVVKKPEPINEPLNKITVQNFSNSKNVHIKKQKPQIHRHK